MWKFADLFDLVQRQPWYSPALVHTPPPLRSLSEAEIGARIRGVAGCRWPPEMLERARLLNEELLQRRPGTDALREAREKCARFRKHPCSKL